MYCWECGERLDFDDEDEYCPECGHHPDEWDDSAYHDPEGQFRDDEYYP